MVNGWSQPIEHAVINVVLGHFILLACVKQCVGCNHFLPLLCSREMAEQAEDLEDMYTKRMELYRKSVKKENRKRRRIMEGTLSKDHLVISSTTTF